MYIKNVGKVVGKGKQLSQALSGFSKIFQRLFYLNSGLFSKQKVIRHTACFSLNFPFYLLSAASQLPHLNTSLVHIFPKFDKSKISVPYCLAKGKI